MQESLFHILQEMMVLNRDNGRKFTVTDRIDKIAELVSDTAFACVYAGSLCRLYAKRPLEALPHSVVLVSAHVDCERGITKCFVKDQGDGTLLGTFDNAASDAACVYLMREKSLSDDVIFAFTGDEEEESGGAIEAARVLDARGKDVRVAVVLDVTDEGWHAGADYTIENDYWADDEIGAKVIETVTAAEGKWLFVPADPDEVPDYVPHGQIIWREAAEDESSAYDDEELDVFSFCVPVCGPMHSDRGCMMRAESFRLYVEMLARLLRAI